MSEIITINTDQIEEVETDVNIVVAQTTSLEVKTQEQYEGASDLLKSVKTKLKDLDALRKSITLPLDTSKKRIMDLFRPPLEKLKTAENTIKRGMIGYDEDQEKKRREYQAKLQREADEKARKEREKLEARAKKWEEKGKAEKAEELLEQAEEVIPETPVVIAAPEKPRGVSYREQWSAEVVDENKVPREYMMVNTKALDKIAQATKGSISISGVKFVSKKILSSRT